MKDILEDIDRWLAAGRQTALARVVDVKGSGPRGPGAAMAVSEDGEVAGSVSGGCVEGAVVSEALDVLVTGVPRVCTFGYSDEESFAVGLTCGGTIEVFVQPLEGRLGMSKEIYGALRAHLRADEPVALATVIEVSAGGPGEEWAREGTGPVAPATAPGATLLFSPNDPRSGSLGDARLDDAVVRDALGQIDAGTTSVRRYGPRGEVGQQEVVVFIEALVPPPQMLIFGAVDFAAALARVAKILGFRVTVCDARPVFATRARFPMADEVVVDWPHRHLGAVGAHLGTRDAVCVLTHDPKFDVPAIGAALRTGVGYIGAMGSRRTTAARERRLRETGVDEAGLSRVMAPIGLDIGARTPEETAVSICAEIVSLRAKAPTSASLSQTAGPIHHQSLSMAG